jgi:hypothetical protein
MSNEPTFAELTSELEGLLKAKYSGFGPQMSVAMMYAALWGTALAYLSHEQLEVMVRNERKSTSSM